MLSHRTLVGLAAVLGVLGVGVARADDYPSRVVTIVVPFAAGGGVDLTARLLAQQLSEDTNQRFIVENKPGASGMVGAQYVAEAKGDGYRLLLTGTTVAISPHLLPNSSFNLDRDLTPISELAVSPYVLVVNPKVPATEPKELMEWAKKNPGALKWGVSGIGSAEHIGLEQLGEMAGVKAKVIPYSGQSAVLVAAVSGEVTGSLMVPSVTKANIEGGTLKALAIASPNEMSVLPGMKTVASYGFPGFSSGTWYALFGPKDMPKELSTKINQAFRKALSAPVVKAKLLTNGAEATGTKSPEEFAQYVKAEGKKYGEIIGKLNLAPAK